MIGTLFVLILLAATLCAVAKLNHEEDSTLWTLVTEHPVPLVPFVPVVGLMAMTWLFCVVEGTAGPVWMYLFVVTVVVMVCLCVYTIVLCIKASRVDTRTIRRTSNPEDLTIHESE